MGWARLFFLCAALLPGLSQAAPVMTEAAPSRMVVFDVMLPLRNRAALDRLVTSQHDPQSPAYHHWITPAQFRVDFGPDEARVARAVSALRARGFSVTRNPRSLHVSGTTAQVSASFTTRLLRVQTSDGATHLWQDRPLTLPPDLAASGAEIVAFTPHRAHPHAHLSARQPDPANRTSATGSYWWDDLKQAYAFPAIDSSMTLNGITRRLDGSGTTIAILMSSDVLDSDIGDNFNHEHWQRLTGRPAPRLAGRRLVNGGAPAAGDAFYEASLDVQQALAGAPGARVILYIVPDLSDGNIIAGYTALVDDNQADIVSSSFGACELAYTARYNGGLNETRILGLEHELFLQGNAEGISFIASSGDSAGKECPNLAYFQGQPGQFVPSVSAPASDPAVTAVGGTNLVTTASPGSLNAAYVSENAWSDPELPYDVDGYGENVSGGVWGAGGGASAIFAKPTYQTWVKTGSAWRMVPDIGMQVGGCPSGLALTSPTPPYCDGGDSALNGEGNGQRSSVVVYAGGIAYGLIGTSVAAPEFAGAAALLVETHGRMGNLNPYLYRLASDQTAGKGTYFHTDIPGYNGVVSTTPRNGWGASVGVGTPIVNELIGLPDVPLAAVPQSVGNP